MYKIILLSFTCNIVVTFLCTSFIIDLYLTFIYRFTCMRCVSPIKTVRDCVACVVNKDYGRRGETTVSRHARQNGKAGGQTTRNLP